MLSTALLLAMANIVAAVPAQGTTPIVSLALPASQLQGGDPGLLRITVSNPDATALSVPAPVLGTALRFQVVDAGGAEIAGNGCEEPHGVAVAQVETLEVARPMVLFVPLAGQFPWFAPGTYNVRCEFGLKAGARVLDETGTVLPATAAFSDVVLSNWVQFTVLPPDPAAVLAIQELPAGPGSPLCFGVQYEDEFDLYLQEHGATPLGHYVSLELEARRNPFGVEQWLSEHAGSVWEARARYLSLHLAVESGEGETARERMTAALLEDAFFGAAVAQWVPSIEELEAKEAAFEAAWQSPE